MMTAIANLIAKVITWLLENWQPLLLATLLCGVVLFGVVKCKDNIIASKDNIIADKDKEIGELTKASNQLENDIIVEEAFGDIDLDKVSTNILDEETLGVINDILDAYNNTVFGGN